VEVYASILSEYEPPSHGSDLGGRCCRDSNEPPMDPGARWLHQAPLAKRLNANAPG